MSKKRILIADDEFYVRDIVVNALSEHYIVLEASDGEEAISMAKKHKPSLILMDILLPKLDGISACRIIKSEIDTSMIPVIMISGRTDKIDGERVKEIYADGHLAKPFDIDELLNKVDEYTRKAYKRKPANISKPSQF